MNEIQKIVTETQIERSMADNLQTAFQQFFADAKPIVEKAKNITVTDEGQTEQMQEARKLRLKLKNIRVDADKTRKKLKEDAIKYNKAVQGIYNVLAYLVEPAEKHLEMQEKFAELQEEKRRAELKAKREMELQPYEEFVPTGLDLANMQEQDYQKILNGAKYQHKQKLEEEARQEQQQKENERKLKILHARQVELAPYRDFSDASLGLDLTEEQYQRMLADAREKKEAYDKQQEEIRRENEKLRLQAEKDRKQREEQRQKQAQLEKELRDKEEAEQKEKEVQKANVEKNRSYSNMRIAPRGAKLQTLKIYEKTRLPDSFLNHVQQHAT